MIDIKELKQQQIQAYKIRCERWYKKSNLEKNIQISALKGYSAYKIDVKQEPDEKVQRLKMSDEFVLFLKEKLPDFTIERKKGLNTNIFNLKQGFEYILISW